MLRVSENKRYLVDEQGRPFFYLADTAWASFPNVPLDQWGPYLRYRKMQGYNALQISMLPIINDRSTGPGAVEAFGLDSEGRPIFSQRNEAYFQKAETMLEMAVAHGFRPVLGMIWCCYAWQRPASDTLRMTAAEVREFCTFAAERFKQFEPIWFISGDTPQDDEEEIDLYLAGLEATRAVDPDALYTMHIRGGAVLHPRLVDGVDFYMYQSSHGASSQANSRELAVAHAELPAKPILNGEPCYEGHGRMGGSGDRNKWSAFDVRRATWQSLLAGATVGITYGAQGVWSGNVHGMRLNREEKKFEAYDWEHAYRLDGSWDAAYAKWVFETLGLADIEPLDVVANGDLEVVVSATPDRRVVIAYAPYTTALHLNLDMSGYNCSIINLADRRTWMPQVTPGTPSVVSPMPFNEDMLLVAIKQ